MSTQEVAKALRVHEDTVKRYAKGGRLDYWTLPGGRLRFSRAVVERFIAESAPSEASA